MQRKHTLNIRKCWDKVFFKISQITNHYLSFTLKILSTKIHTRIFLQLYWSLFAPTLTELSFQNFIWDRKRPPLCFIKLSFLYLVLPFYTLSSCIYDSSNYFNFLLTRKRMSLVLVEKSVLSLSWYCYLHSFATAVRQKTKIAAP